VVDAVQQIRQRGGERQIRGLGDHRTVDAVDHLARLRLAVDGQLGGQRRDAARDRQRPLARSYRRGGHDEIGRADLTDDRRGVGEQQRGRPTRVVAADDRERAAAALGDVEREPLAEVDLPGVQAGRNQHLIGAGWTPSRDDRERGASV
jgi:hypothetical protein